MADRRHGSDAPAGKPPLWLWPGVVAVGTAGGCMSWWLTLYPRGW